MNNESGGNTDDKKINMNDSDEKIIDPYGDLIDPDADIIDGCASLLKIFFVIFCAMILLLIYLWL
jgi:hypothetical protein